MTYPLKSLLAATALSLTAGFAAPAMADAETDALKQEVKALEARINQLEKRNAKKEAHVYAAAPETAAANVPAQASVAQRLAIVERNQELAKEDAAAKAKTTPKIEVGSKGLVIASPDNQYSLNLHGYVQADDRTFFGNGATGPTNTFLIRSARPVFDAKMTDYFNARLMVDFGRGQTTLLDAYGDFHPMPQNDYVSLRIGEFKVPIGLERWQPESDVLFVERGQTTNLVPYRDIGVMAHGNLIPDQLEYELGITNGAADLQANNTDTDNNKDGVARIFAHPFQWTGVQALQGLGLGIGGTYGVHQGSPTAPGLVAGYASVGQRVYFAYRNAGGAGTTYADGPQWRVNPQGTYYNGPFGLMGEYVLNDQQVARGTSVARLKNTAWEGIASYVLTGEDASFSGVKPAHNFSPGSGDWGAFEVVARLSELDVDRKAFTVFADPAVSSRSAHESTIGGTWYFNPSVKFNVDFSYTTFDGGAIAGADHASEKAVLSRAQFRF